LTFWKKQKCLCKGDPELSMTRNCRVHCTIEYKLSFFSSPCCCVFFPFKCFVIVVNHYFENMIVILTLFVCCTIMCYRYEIKNLLLLLLLLLLLFLLLLLLLLLLLYEKASHYAPKNLTLSYALYSPFFCFLKRRFCFKFNQKNQKRHKVLFRE